MDNKDRGPVNMSNDDPKGEENVLEEDIPQHIETLKPVTGTHVTPRRNLKRTCWKT